MSMAAFDLKSRSIKPITKWHFATENQQKCLNIDQAALLGELACHCKRTVSYLFPLKCYCEFNCWEGIMASSKQVPKISVK